MRGLPCVSIHFHFANQWFTMIYNYFDTETFPCSFLTIWNVGVFNPHSSIRHENASGYYRTSAYFLSKVLVDLIPNRIVPILIFSSITYFLMGMYCNTSLTEYIHCLLLNYAANINYIIFQLKMLILGRELPTQRKSYEIN